MELWKKFGDEWVKCPLRMGDPIDNVFAHSDESLRDMVFHEINIRGEPRWIVFSADEAGELDRIARLLGLHGTYPACELLEMMIYTASWRSLKSTYKVCIPSDEASLPRLAIFIDGKENHIE